MSNIRNLKKYDAKDLCTKVKEGKIENTMLNSLLEYATYNEQNKIVLNTPLIKVDFLFSKDYRVK